MALNEINGGFTVAIWANRSPPAGEGGVGLVGWGVGGEDEAVGDVVDDDLAAWRVFAFQELGGERVLDALLDDPFQWAGTVNGVVALAGDGIHRCVGELNLEVRIG